MLKKKILEFLYAHGILRHRTEFAVYDNTGSKVDVLSSTRKGEAVCKDLPFGSYTVRENDPSAEASLSLIARRIWRRYWSFVLLAALVVFAAMMLSGIATAVMAEEPQEIPDVQDEIEPITVQLLFYDAAPASSGVAEEQAVSMDIPDVDTSVKTFMSYKAITDRSSVQWKLQQKAVTNEYGFREIDGMYLVALGTYYSDHAGAMFRITLENGTVFDAIMGDVKADKDTDRKNQHRYGNVVEFIVDTPKLAEDARLMGDVSYTPGAGLMGPVQSIKYLGEYEF